MFTVRQSSRGAQRSPISKSSIPKLPVIIVSSLSHVPHHRRWILRTVSTFQKGAPAESSLILSSPQSEHQPNAILDGYS